MSEIAIGLKMDQRGEYGKPSTSKEACSVWNGGKAARPYLSLHLLLFTHISRYMRKGCALASKQSVCPRMGMVSCKTSLKGCCLVRPTCFAQERHMTFQGCPGLRVLASKSLFTNCKGLSVQGFCLGKIASPRLQ